MKRTTTTPIISPGRLFAAADLLLKAIGSSDGLDSLVSMRVGPARIGSSSPAGVFTCEELVEAMAMLIRMGLVPGRRIAC